MSEPKKKVIFNGGSLHDKEKYIDESQTEYFDNPIGYTFVYRQLKFNGEWLIIQGSHIFIHEETQQ